jgi:hypothetical protein
MTPTPGYTQSRPCAATGGRSFPERPQWTVTIHSTTPTCTSTRTRSRLLGARTATQTAGTCPATPTAVRPHTIQQPVATLVNAKASTAHGRTRTGTVPSVAPQPRPAGTASTAAGAAGVLGPAEDVGSSPQHYHICLFRDDRLMTPVVRIVVRDSDDDAVESARRWLRLVRRTNAGQPRLPDRWSVARATATTLPRIIASGSADDT